jgi:hypothetical protein
VYRGKSGKPGSLYLPVPFFYSATRAPWRAAAHRGCRPGTPSQHGGMDRKRRACRGVVWCGSGRVDILLVGGKRALALLQSPHARTINSKLGGACILCWSPPLPYMNVTIRRRSERKLARCTPNFQLLGNVGKVGKGVLFKLLSPIQANQT